MAILETSYEHIVLSDAGVPMIARTSTKVHQLVLDKMAYGWSPEELQFQHPDLTLGEIHSALAYYWDHRKEMDREIEGRLEFVDRLRAEAGPSPLASRLKAKELI